VLTVGSFGVKESARDAKMQSKYGFVFNSWYWWVEDVASSVVYTQLTGGWTMRLGLKGRIAKIFNQVFVGAVGDTA